MNSLTNNQKAKLEDLINKFFESDEWVENPIIYITDDTPVILVEIINSVICQSRDIQDFMQNQQH